MPDIQTWVSQTNKFENYKERRDILEQEKGDVSYTETSGTQIGMIFKNVSSG
jgi:hypothetical protein